MLTDISKNWFVNNRSDISFLLLFWASIGTWDLSVELPFMAPYLPESWDLGALFGLVSGACNLYLLFIPIFMKFGLKRSLIFCYTIGLILSVLLIFFWDATIKPKGRIAEKEFSFGFPFLTFFLLALDGARGTLSTLSYAWVERDYPPGFVTAILVGEVSGGLIAVSVTYLQGYKIMFSGIDQYQQNVAASENDNYLRSKNGSFLSTDFLFGPTTNFFLMTLLYGSSFTAFGAFMYLSQSKNVKTNRAEIKNETEKLVDQSCQEVEIDINSETAITDNEELNFYRKFKCDWILQVVQLSSCHKYFMLVLTFLTGGAIFSFSASFISYTSLPYSQRCYTFAVSFSGLCFPLTAILAHFKCIQKVLTFSFALLLHLVICIVLVGIALLSPNPPFVGHILAELFIVFLWYTQAVTGYLVYSSAMHGLRSMNSEHCVVLGAICGNIGEIVIGTICYILITDTDLFEAGFT